MLNRLARQAEARVEAKPPFFHIQLRSYKGLLRGSCTSRYECGLDKRSGKRELGGDEASPLQKGSCLGVRTHGLRGVRVDVCRLASGVRHARVVCVLGVRRRRGPGFENSFDRSPPRLSFLGGCFYHPVWYRLWFSFYSSLSSQMIRASFVVTRPNFCVITKVPDKERSGGKLISAQLQGHLAGSCSIHSAMLSVWKQASVVSKIQ